jgi:hypothetical protein
MRPFHSLMTHDVEMNRRAGYASWCFDVGAPHRILTAIATDQALSGLIVEPQECAFGHDLIVVFLEALW